MGIKRRYNHIDFIRGICIALMIIDHILFFSTIYNDLLWDENTYNAVQKILVQILNIFFHSEYSLLRSKIRFIVLSVFFVISGISCSLSRNNIKRFIKMAVAAIIITASSLFLSLLIKRDVSIIWGVLHCYAACILLYIFLHKIGNISMAIVASVLLILGGFSIYFQFELESSWLLVPLGIPPKNFTYAIEYFPILKWIGIFFSGVVIGRNVYAIKNLMLSSKFSASKNIISILGRHGMIVYLMHFPLIFLFLTLISNF